MTATDDYLRYRAAGFGTSAVVLDLGCGDARFVEMLLDDGLSVVGVDIPAARPSIEARAARRPALNLLSRISFFRIPSVFRWKTIAWMSSCLTLYSSTS